MTLQEILDFCVYQAGSMGSDEGIDDLENDAQTIIRGYVNDAQRIICRDYWRPYFIEQTTLDADGNVDASTLSKTFDTLLGFARRKEDLLLEGSRFVPIDPLDQMIGGLATDPGLLPIGKPGETMWVRYSYLPEVLEDGDELEIPEKYHRAICDYATWRFMSTGNSDKQNRAQFFAGRWYDEVNRIRPYGEKTFNLSRMKNLFTR